jgi:hypothetical protein
MRIRKILPLALLAVGMLFMLTSCDKLLDFIFSSNTINVTVEAYAPKYYYGTQGTITLTLYDSSGNPTVAGPVASSNNDGYWVFYNFSFPKLANGTYQMTASYSGYLNGSYLITPGGPWFNNYFFDPSGNYTYQVTLPYSATGVSPNNISVTLVMP